MNQRKAIEEEFSNSMTRSSTYAAVVEVLDMVISQFESNPEEARGDLLCLRKAFDRARHWQEGIARDALALLELDDELREKSFRYGLESG